MDPRITRFLIPIGATVNMDGSAIGIPLRIIYMAQLCGRTFGFGERHSLTIIKMFIGTVSVATGIGLAGIPGEGIVATMTILSSVGLPVDMIAYTLPTEWLQNRLGAAVNVVGDAYGAVIIGHLSKKDLEKVSANRLPDHHSDVEHKTDNSKGAIV